MITDMSMPSRVKWVIAGLVVQTLGNGLFGVLALSMAIWERDAGFDRSDLADDLVPVFLMLAVLSLVCAAGIALRRGWMRNMTFAYELVAVAVYLVATVGRGLDSTVIGSVTLGVCAVALVAGIVHLLRSAAV